MSFACLYIPDFVAQAVVRSEPTLRERAVAIVEGVAPLVKVVGLNKKARQAGTQIGMTKLQVTECPSIEVRQRSPAQEAAAHAALLDCAYAFSPVIEATAQDTVVLELAGLDRLFAKSPLRAKPSPAFFDRGALWPPSGGQSPLLLSFPEEVAYRLAQCASDIGLEAHIALAQNPDAAVCAARGCPGITLIAPGREAEHLGGLPVEVLVPPAEILETLCRWGVRTLGELAQLPNLPLSERLGREGLRLQALARGTGSRPLVRWEPELGFEETMELEHPIAMLDPLMFVLARLIDQLCLRLAARVLAANELRLWLELEIRNSKLETRNLASEIENPKADERVSNQYKKTLRLPVPMRDAKVFLKLLQLALKSDPPQSPVLKVTLAAEPVKPRLAQRGLFLPLSPDPEKLEVMLARIAGLVGEENAGSAELVDTHHPGAFRMRRFNPKGAGRGSSVKPGQFPSRLASGGIETPPSRYTTTSLRLFRPPRRATVELRAGCPARVFAGNVRGKVVSAAGPWRTSGDWWREDVWEHEEWDIELEKSPVASGQLSVVTQNFSSAAFQAASLYDHSSPAYATQEETSRTEALRAANLEVCVAKPSAGEKSRTTDRGQRTTDVVLYRIYRDLATGSWFVQGSYD